MAKITVAGNAVVITANTKLEEIKMLEKVNPKALTLYGGDDGKEPIFTIGTGAAGSVNKYGIVFSGETNDEEKFATATLLFNRSGDEEIKAAVADKLFGIIMNLNKLEATLTAAVEEITAAKAETENCITVVQ